MRIRQKKLNEILNPLRGFFQRSQITVEFNFKMLSKIGQCERHTAFKIERIIGNLYSESMQCTAFFEKKNLY